MKYQKVVSKAEVLPSDIWTELISNLHVLELLEVTLVSKIHTKLCIEYLRRVYKYGIFSTINIAEIVTLVSRGAKYLIDRLAKYRYVDPDLIYYGACLGGNLELARQYISPHISAKYASYLAGMGGKISLDEIKDPDYCAALTGACENGHIYYIEYLEQLMGEDQVIEWVIENDDITVIEYLVKKENMRDFALYALHTKSINIAKCFIKYCTVEDLGSWAYICGLSNDVPSDDIDIIERAIMYGRVDLLEKHLTNEYTIDLLLEIAILYKQEDVVKYLLKKTETISAKVIKYAVENRCIQYLFNHGDISHAYECAIKRNSCSTIAQLISQGIKFNKDHILLTIEYDKIDMLLLLLRYRYLLEYEIDVNYIKEHVSNMPGDISHYINSVNSSSIEGILQ